MDLTVCMQWIKILLKSFLAKQLLKSKCINKKCKNLTFCAVVTEIFSSDLDRIHHSRQHFMHLFRMQLFAVIRWNFGSFSPLSEMGVRLSVVMGINSSGKTNIGTVTWHIDTNFCFRRCCLFLTLLPNPHCKLSRIKDFKSNFHISYICVSTIEKSILTHISLASYFWHIGKQRRPRSDAFYGIWSGSSLAAYRNFYQKPNQDENTHQTPIKWKMDSSN